jgi:hypothetical protein
MRCVGLVMAWLLGQAGQAGSVEQVLVFMKGTWRGDGLELVLDTERMQGNLRADLPFQRDALVLRNISAKVVVFDIGTDRFIGLFDGDDLALTGSSLKRAMRLRRVVK